MHTLEASCAHSKLNRRWQKEGAGRYESLPPLSWLLEQLPPLDNSAGMADIADVYSVLSVLHAKSRNPTPAACLHQGFYFFWADTPRTGTGLDTAAAEKVRGAQHQ